ENARRLRWPARQLAADALRPPFEATFERVVVDLPCSGTGTLRKHPELKWRINASEIGRLAAQAEAMLAGVAPRVAPRGLLVAITCSLGREENEPVVPRSPGRHADFAPAALAGGLPPALERFVVGAGFWRVLTGGDHDGFTVHVMRRAV